MKNILPLILTTALCTAQAAFAQGVSIESARFCPADDPSWQKPDFDDSAWDVLRLDSEWDLQGVTLNHGFAWYRLHVVIPSSLKDSRTGKIVLDIGPVDDCDETYFNGHLVGKTGTTPEDPGGYDGDWLKERRYLADASWVRWDRDNVIAVRVYNEEGEGGFYKRPARVEKPVLGDFVSLGVSKENGAARAVLSSTIKTEGTMTETVEDVLEGKVLSTRSWKVRLSGKKSLVYDKPLEGQTRVMYTYADRSFDDFVDVCFSNPYILTPPAPAMPRYNGPLVFGVSPGFPVIFRLAFSGDKPMTYSVEGLPEGVMLDSDKGVLSGSVKEAGDYPLVFTATNAKGSSSASFTLKVGDGIGLTPPMGWNSWNCWGQSVSQEKVMASATALIDRGLADYGYCYVNIDDAWEAVERGSDGTISANEKFPDMKGLADWLHENGLKFGIYSGPGERTCGGYPASLGHEKQDAEVWNEWGVDYLKYDWCSYERVREQENDWGFASCIRPYLLMQKYLREQPRDIFYSLGPLGGTQVYLWGLYCDGNSWRTAQDIDDTWESIVDVGFRQQAGLEKYSSVGHWNDPDMLVVGKVGWSSSLRDTRLTPDEQYSHISLWSLLASNLLIGCPIDQMDDFTFNLLCNNEVNAVNQDILGRQAHQDVVEDGMQIWSRDLYDGGKAVGIFNLSDAAVPTLLRGALEKIGIEASSVRDLWRQKDIPTDAVYRIPSHGVLYVKVPLTPVSEVDPFIGTALDGHTSPAASAPFGLVQLGPDTPDGGVAGYHDKDREILGFSHTHLSGTGQGDLGDFLFVPVIGEVPQNQDGFAVKPLPFSHKDEKAGAGYYQVKFPSTGITAEMTALPHTGCHRYTFSGKGERRILVDMGHTLAFAKADDIFLKPVSDKQITGGRHVSGWAPDRWVYFSALFSEPFTGCETDGHDRWLLSFPESVKDLTISVGLSPVDAQGAENNRLAEMPEADFDSALAASEALWAGSLGRIAVEGGSQDRRTVFYTALYHSLLVPNRMADLDGSYKNHLGEVKKAPSGMGFYFPLSLWDTFRSWNPLMTLLEPDLVNGMVFSMLDMYDLNGRLPLWPLWGDEVDCMIGYHCVSVIADAWLRGIRGFDGEKALKAMIDASNSYPATDWYNQYGYIPCDLTPQSVSMTLEYAYDDWCIARMAESLGHKDIAAEYDQRALRYRNILDTSTGFFRGKDSDGNWRAPFTPDGTGREASRDYTEATAWQYRHFVTHDAAGFAAMMGGEQAAKASLDSLFESGYSDLDEHAEWFVTGRIGKYAHGNEPSHATAWLYTALGDPSSTQRYVREIVDNLYSTGPDGLCGNEDCGQMSAWYVFAALGLYPLCPGTGEYVFSAPVFPKATVTLGNGKQLTITADHPEYTYIKEVSLNGEPVDAQYITYDQLMAGGELSFKLSKEPCHDRDGLKAPYSMSDGKVVSAPYLTGNPRFFDKEFTVDLRSRTEGAEIRFTLDGSEPSETSPLYDKPFRIGKDAVIKAKAFKDGFEPGPLMTAHAFPVEYIPAKKVSSTSPGCLYTYHRGEFKMSSDVIASPVVSKGTMPVPSIAGAPDEDHFGYVFTGYIDIPEDGLWEFALRSDDGSILEIDGRLAVNNDGSHSDYTATGQAALRKGLHAFRLVYLEDYEGQVLGWSWKAPSSDTFSEIPEANICHLPSLACTRIQPAGPLSWQEGWGDAGDGTYKNPVLAADYSDPDVIRHGDKYYMVASDFHFMGMQVLESPDLVNWKLISQIYDRFDLPGWNGMEHYAGGSWAPAIRYHDGLFHVYFCTPDEGLFVSTAKDPAGPWSPLHCVKAVVGWEDPCPFWDEDGQAYLGHSLRGAGPIIIHKMSQDGKELLDEGVTVYQGPTAEGTKIHKLGGYYYLSIPEGGVRGGWQTVLRSRDIYGPYERKIVLETGSTGINGPHQGAIVDTPYGEWWFIHFQQRDPLGRIVHLQPMRWEDEWPVMGEDYDGNGVGEPVPGWTKPRTKKPVKPFLPASSDDFSGKRLGLQWQFNHNPVDEAWSLGSRKGFLAIDALYADSFRKARNTVSQKIMGFTGFYTVSIDLKDMSDGQYAGMACMGRDNYCAGVRKSAGKLSFSFEKDGEVLKEAAFEGSKVLIRMSFDIEGNVFGFSYSADGKDFLPAGDTFEANFGYWKGARVALFSYNGDASAGTALFDEFVYTTDI